MSGVPETDPSQPPVDWDKAMSEFDNDRDFLIHLLEGFGTRFVEMSVSIDRLCGDRSGELRRLIHKLKGSAGNLYAFRLFRMAENWELEILEGRTDRDREQFSRILVEAKRISEFLDVKKGESPEPDLQES